MTRDLLCQLSLRIRCPTTARGPAFHSPWSSVS